MKHQKMLSLIRERLNQLGPEEVIKQLHACRSPGPTVEEFLSDCIEYNDLYDSCFSVPFAQDYSCHVVLIAANNDENYFDTWEDFQAYDMAA